MGIEANFDHTALDAYIESRKRVLEDLILRNLNYLGMKCVATARLLDTYKDRTANLRNSIGYLILKNGAVHAEFFKADGRGADFKADQPGGEVVGSEFARTLVTEYPTGYVLIVVAGMHYASYVEDLHGLPVLQPAENMAKQEINGIVNSILKSMKKRA